MSTHNDDQNVNPPPGRPSVVIFGAGVTGLTAAHELVERGWKVTVVEKEIDPLDIDQCAVGGIAKTQWAVYQAGETCPRPLRAKPLIPTVRLRLETRSPNSIQPATFPDHLDQTSKTYWERLLARIDYVQGPLCPKLSISRGRDANPEFAQGVCRALTQKGVDFREKETPDPSIPPRAVQVETDLSDASNASEPDAFSTILPGEHGFRFFPAFYRHIFDTLRRIQVRRSGASYNDEFRTVFDNLIPTEANWLALSDTSCRPSSDVIHAQDGTNVVKFLRRLPRSLREIFDATEDLQAKLGYTARDIELLKLRLFKYMTSCASRRRHEYQGITWAEFLGISDLSEVCRRDMERAPQLLAAMTASESDARTQGNIACQLLLDPIANEERVDSTLNAPTTTAWFGPWKEYLVSQGVQFLPGELLGFERGPGGKICPKTTIPQFAFNDTSYFVLAVPVQEWGRCDHALVQSWKDARGAHVEDDIERLGEWLGQAGSDFTPGFPNPNPLLKGLSGIQLYFDQDQMSRSGHTLFMDSPWRLTAISQANFWHRRRELFDGYRGIVSIDIGTLERPKGDPDPAEGWFCDTPLGEVHSRVWSQVNASFGEPAERTWPANYRAYHIDEYIRYKRPKDEWLPAANLAPFLINGVDEWVKRPGWVNGVEPQSTTANVPSKARYQMMPVTKASESQWVLAGTFMQTWTRATTMESANESARHAVNSLLEHASKYHPGENFKQAQFCRIWNPEQNEHDDLRIWQELDERLFHWEGEQLPHAFDILGLDSIPDAFLEGEGAASVLGRLGSSVEMRSPLGGRAQ